MLSHSYRFDQTYPRQPFLDGTAGLSPNLPQQPTGRILAPDQGGISRGNIASRGIPAAVSASEICSVLWYGTCETNEHFYTSIFQKKILVEESTGSFAKTSVHVCIVK